ncbi:MAG: methytransferase partner Trm112 [Candidatus Thermoplasmatota archaeon]
MRKEILDILCCPVCKGNLTLTVTCEENDEILSGSFFCETCNVSYPISDGIPDLLPR